METLYYALPLLFLVAGGLRLRRYIQLRHFLPVEAKVTRSEPKLVEGDVQAGAYVADIELTYAVNGKSYLFRPVSDKRWSLNSDHIRQQCECFRVGQLQRLWHHPGCPSVAVVRNEFDWFGFNALTVGVICAAWFATNMPVADTYALTILISWAVLDSVCQFLRDGFGLTASRTSFLEVEHLSLARGMANFFEKYQTQLCELTFTPLLNFCTPITTYFGHRDANAVYVSPDGHTTAVIGHVWYARRLLGLIPMRMIGLKNIYFKSCLSDHTILSTRFSKTGVSNDAVAGVYRYAVSGSLTLAQMYEKHLKVLQELARRRGAEVLEVATKGEAMALLQREADQMCT